MYMSISQKNSRQKSTWMEHISWDFPPCGSKKKKEIKIYHLLKLPSQSATAKEIAVTFISQFSSVNSCCGKIIHVEQVFFDLKNII